MLGLFDGLLLGELDGEPLGLLEGEPEGLAELETTKSPPSQLSKRAPVDTDHPQIPAAPLEIAESVLAPMPDVDPLTIGRIDVPLASIRITSLAVNDVPFDPSCVHDPDTILNRYDAPVSV